MALRKSKIEILDKITKTDLIEQLEYNVWYDYDDYYDDYDDYCDCCGYRYCECQGYEYQEEEDVKVIYVGRSFGRWHIISRNRFELGRFIDMNTIYSKEVLRQKKINYLLGIEKYEIQPRPTIGDYYNEKLLGIK
jgi:hypothetical protein